MYKHISAFMHTYKGDFHIGQGLASFGNNTKHNKTVEGRISQPTVNQLCQHDLNPLPTHIVHT